MVWEATIGIGEDPSQALRTGWLHSADTNSYGTITGSTEFTYKGGQREVLTINTASSGLYFDFRAASPNADTLVNATSNLTLHVGSTTLSLDTDHADDPQEAGKLAYWLNAGVSWTVGDSVDVKLTTTEPGAPTGVAATAASATSMRLDWEAPSSTGGSAITGYDYQVRTGTTWGSWTSIPSSASLTDFTVPGLTATTAYGFRMRANNTAGDGLWSDVAEGTTGGTTHACSADSATNRIWTGNMTLGTRTALGITRVGWHIGTDFSGAMLTDKDFDFAGENYEFDRIQLSFGSLLGITFRSSGAGDIATQATRDALTLHVGGSATLFNLGAGILASNQVAIGWSNSGLSWTAGDVICLAMTIDPPAIEKIELTSDPDTTGPDDDTYVIGDTITATVTFDSPVDLATDPADGPSLPIKVGGFRFEADCAMATNKTEVRCSLTIRDVVHSDDTDGVSLPANRLARKAGSITATGHPTIAANLAHEALADDIEHKVDAVRPTVESAGARGATITLIWSEKLDTGSVPSGNGGFTLAVTTGTAPTVTAVAIDADNPTKMTLTLSAELPAGSGPTLDYAPPATSPVQDVPGNDAAEFDPAQMVTVVTYEWDFTLTGTTLTEGGGSVTATATITEGGPATAPVTVQLKWDGANVGTGLVHGANGASVIAIATGGTTGSLEISAPEDDGEQVYHPDRTAALSAVSGTEIDSVDLTREDNDSQPVATIAVTTDPAPAEGTEPKAEEGEHDIVVTATLDRAFGVAASIPFAVTGDTGALDGFTARTFEFSAGAKTSQRTASLVDDSVQDGARSVTFTVQTNADFDHYTLGSPSSAKIPILDDDTPPGAPENLRAQAGPNQVALTWDEPSDGGGGQPIDHYE